MTSSRARRSVLPALSAAVAGALIAGAATVLVNPTGAVAGQGRLSLAGTAQLPDPSGGLVRPAPSSPSSTAPANPAPPTSSTSPTTPSESPPASPTPPPSSAPPPPAPPPAPDTSQQGEVVQYVNAFRAERGCAPVRIDSRLTRAAQAHSADMANRRYFSHNTPEGVTFDQRIRNAGYPNPGAENIARGAQSAEEVMRMWMESDGHRANILNCDLTTIGVGLARNGWFWTQDFGY